MFILGTVKLFHGSINNSKNGAVLFLLILSFWFCHVHSPKTREPLGCFGFLFANEIKQRPLVSLQLMGTEFHLTSAPSFSPVRHKTCEPGTYMKGTQKLSQNICKFLTAETPANPPDSSWDSASSLSCWSMP